jgi:3-(3-hydroxy-phenyl)propionate hydroxylase
MSRETVRFPYVAIVGAGPVGLTTALRLSSFGVACSILEANPGVQRRGSKALCVQHAALKILDGVGCARPLIEQGRPWSISRTFVRGKELFHTLFTAPEGDHLPPFVNIPQFRTEEVLLDQALKTGMIEVLWSHRITGLEQDDAGVTLWIEGPEGPRAMRFAYVIGCDGIGSEVRRAAGAAWLGHSHLDRFLIMDIRAPINRPHERHFYFDAPSNPGRQIVVHPQPGDLWRFDWQLPPDTDVDEERRSGRLDERVQALTLGAPYEIEWLSSYRFHQRIVDRMRIGRVLLAGDAAHALPPFGARGMNSGIQDADNLAWKLALVVKGRAPSSLLSTYHIERHAAARENLAITEATIRFMVPPTPLHRWARDLLLRLSMERRSLRRFVNSGRMSEPARYADSPIVALHRRRRRALSGLPAAGALVPDLPCKVGGRVMRLRALSRQTFLGVYLCIDPDRAAAFAAAALLRPPAVPFQLYVVPPVGLRMDNLPRGTAALDDHTGALNGKLGADGPIFYLIRPDGYIAERRLQLSGEEVSELVEQAAGVAGVAALPPIPQPLSPDFGGKGRSTAVRRAISLPPQMGGKGRG